MFDANDPAQGGSPYLQAKIFWAQHRLEDALKTGEMVVFVSVVMK
jgi:hypothetical protein